jgi:hypothetical protein
MAAQMTLALRQVREGASAAFDWVASESWANEIVDLAEGAIREEVIIGGRRGARKLGVALTDFIDRPNVQDAIRNHTFDFARKVNETSAKRLSLTMATGMDAGESIPELTKRVQTVFGAIDPKTGKPIDPERAIWWRSERIARTESARAISAGQELQWQETGVVSAKQWDAMGDACPFCLEMDGKITELGTAFWKTGETMTVQFNDRPINLSFNYLPVMGPPLHPACRCSENPVLIEQ